MEENESSEEASATRAAISQACEGLLFPSETDAPVTPVFLARGQRTALTLEALREQFSLPAEVPAEEVAFDDFFAGYDPAQGDPADPQQQATLTRLQQLKAVLAAHLTGLKVFRAGHVEIGLYILGLTPEDDVAGVQTRAVET